MLFIWGFKARFTVLKSVFFACPRCGADRDGTLRQARRWFTFFFIPIVPLKLLSQFVECGTCKNRFDPRVLGVPTTAQISDDLLNATRVGVAAMVRASSNEGPSRDAAVALMRDHIQQYDQSQLDVDLAASDTEQLMGWLRHLAGTLSPHGKEQFFSAMAGIALADGPLEEAERSLLESIGQALLMTPAQVIGLFAIIQQQSTPSP